MKNICMQIVAGAALLMIIGTSQLFVYGQDPKKESSDVSIESFLTDNRIIGTWQTSVTAINCQTGEPLAPAFPGILTFNLGKTLTGTSTTAPAVFGSWANTHGRRHYSFAFLSLRYSPTGAFIGTQKVWQEALIAPNGDSFTSSGTAQILDAAGNTVGTGCAASTGSRFE